MPNKMKNQAAIVGIGQTEFSKDSGRTEMTLAVECVTAALDDAGLSPKDVDGMCVFTMENNPEIQVQRNIGGGDLRFYSRIHYGGGAACATVHHAAMAVATGSADVVVCYRAMNERSGRRFGSGVQDRKQEASAEGSQYAMYSPFGLTTPGSWVAMYTQRYMHQYGATSEDLGRVAVSSRGYAAKNPDAWFYERPITLEEHQKSRWIVEPLHLLDCCQESDGGVAVVITSAERAKDLKQKPVMIKGSGQGAANQQHMMTSYYRPDITGLPELGLAIREAYESAGVGPDDIGAGVLYDAFSPVVLITLEEMGIVKPGEAADFIKDGHLDPGGRLPSNTNGGQLGEAYIHGMNGVNEGVRLIRGTSSNQPGDTDNVLVTGGSGVPTSALVLGQP